MAPSFSKHSWPHSAMKKRRLSMPLATIALLYLALKFPQQLQYVHSIATPNQERKDDLPSHVLKGFDWSLLTHMNEVKAFHALLQDNQWPQPSRNGPYGYFVWVSDYLVPNRKEDGGTTFVPSTPAMKAIPREVVAIAKYNSPANGPNPASSSTTPTQRRSSKTHALYKVEGLCLATDCNFSSYFPSYIEELTGPARDKIRDGIVRMLHELYEHLAKVVSKHPAEEALRIPYQLPILLGGMELEKWDPVDMKVLGRLATEVTGEPFYFDEYNASEIRELTLPLNAHEWKLNRGDAPANVEPLCIHMLECECVKASLTASQLTNPKEVEQFHRLLEENNWLQGELYFVWLCADANRCRCGDQHGINDEKKGMLDEHTSSNRREVLAVASVATIPTRPNKSTPRKRRWRVLEKEAKGMSGTYGVYSVEKIGFSDVGLQTEGGFDELLLGFLSGLYTNLARAHHQQSQQLRAGTRGGPRRPTTTTSPDSMRLHVNVPLYRRGVRLGAKSVDKHLLQQLAKKVAGKEKSFLSEDGNVLTLPFGVHKWRIVNRILGTFGLV